MEDDVKVAIGHCRNIVLGLLIAYCIYIIAAWIFTPPVVENFSYNTCDAVGINDATKKIFADNGVNFEKNPAAANLYIPCGYTYAEKELEQIDGFLNSEQTMVYAVSGCDQLVGKNNVWKTLVEKYGRTGAKGIMPETWLLDSDHDAAHFVANRKHGKIYICKKNIQRQEGLKLIPPGHPLDVNAVRALYNNEGYVVIQEFMDNPMLVNGHKINLRVYLLVVCDPKLNTRSAHVFNDGFMYYTKKPHKYVPDPEYTITTGYIDRSVYDMNPLTHTDFKRFVGPMRSVQIFNNIHSVIRRLMDAIFDKLCSKNKGVKSFQIFGLDVAPDTQGNCFVIEANKAPSVQEMDARDAAVKFKMQNDVYRVVGLLPDSNANGFQKIWEKTVY